MLFCSSFSRSFTSPLCSWINFSGPELFFNSVINSWMANSALIKWLHSSSKETELLDEIDVVAVEESSLEERVEGDGVLSVIALNNWFR